MAATPQRRSQRESAKVSKKNVTAAAAVAVNKPKAKQGDASTLVSNNSKTASRDELNMTMEDMHLPPLSLVLTVLFCSGFMLMFALRDFMSTGRNILGQADEDMMLWTKSTEWFHDGKDGWKSKAGGFSAVMSITTDANNMGGFFVRKMSGAAATALCCHKMIPLVFVHPTGAIWQQHHFTPLLYTSIIANLSVILFFVVYWNEFWHAHVTTLPMMQMTVLALETLVMLYHLLTLSSTSKSCASTRPAVALNKDGKTPNSPPSRIVARTVSIVSTAVVLICLRDLFFPGCILPFLPRDDLYLEWTNAFLHSPPLGSPEMLLHGMESPLYIGDLYISQYMALQLILLGCYKYVTCLFIRHGSDGRGQVQARMIWQCSTLGNAMILFLLRLFSSAATSASLDLRYHLMALGYETFILGLYGFF